MVSIKNLQIDDSISNMETLENLRNCIKSSQCCSSGVIELDTVDDECKYSNFGDPSGSTLLWNHKCFGVRNISMSKKTNSCSLDSGIISVHTSDFSIWI